MGRLLPKGEPQSVDQRFPLPACWMSLFYISRCPQMVPWDFQPLVILCDRIGSLCFPVSTSLGHILKYTLHMSAFVSGSNFGETQVKVTRLHF